MKAKKQVDKLTGALSFYRVRRSGKGGVALDFMGVQNLIVARLCQLQRRKNGIDKQMQQNDLIFAPVLRNQFHFQARADDIPARSCALIGRQVYEKEARNGCFSGAFSPLCTNFAAFSCASWTPWPHIDAT